MNCIFDKSVLIEIGDDIICRKIIIMFESDISKYINIIELAKGDTLKLLDAIHQVKGVTANVGALKVFNACKNVEEGIRSGASVNDLVEQICNQYLPELREYLRTMQPWGRPVALTEWGRSVALTEAHHGRPCP